MNNWYEIRKIDDKLYIIHENIHWEKTNIYFFIGEKYNLLIDTGTGIQSLLKILLEIDGKPIRVVTTHIHWDHIGNHKEFDSFYVHEEESLWLENGIPLADKIIFNQMIKDVDHKYLDDNMTFENFKCFKTDSYSLISDGDIFDLGNQVLKVLHTPGHSPGHLMFYDSVRKALITGDACYEGEVFCNYESTDPEDLYESYKRIIDLEIKLVLPGHGDSPIDKRIILEGYRLLKRHSELKVLRHGYGKIKGDRISFNL